MNPSQNLEASDIQEEGVTLSDDPEFCTGDPGLDELLTNTHYLATDGGMENALIWHQSLLEYQAKKPHGIYDESWLDKFKQLLNRVIKESMAHTSAFGDDDDSTLREAESMLLAHVEMCDPYSQVRVGSKWCKSRFESWAASHGEIDLSEATGLKSDKHTLFPCTYLERETEIAWRACSNTPNTLAHGPRFQSANSAVASVLIQALKAERIDRPMTAHEEIIIRNVMAKISPLYAFHQHDREGSKNVQSIDE